MPLLIFVLIYWFIGFCYMRAHVSGFHLEWLADIILAPLWVYFVLVRIFQYIDKKLDGEE